MRKAFLWVLLVLALPVSGAELVFDLGDFATNAPPTGFRSALYGHGQAPDWQITMEEVPSAFEPATSKAPAANRRPAVTQVNHDPTDERFPLLIYDGEVFGDFTLTTRFKITDGVMEQVAGIAFRIQNETNFYVIRANAMDNTVRFYKVVDGFRSPMLGPKILVALGKWHELKIECKGNQMNAWLDDIAALKNITDTTFNHGKIGYWTKSDSMCSFAGTRIEYQRQEILAQVIVNDLVRQFSRVLDLKIYMPDTNAVPRVVAAKNPADIGKAGVKAEQDAIDRGVVFVAKGKRMVSLVMPLRDRNGDPMGAMEIGLETFPGQTEDNVITRGIPFVKSIEERGKSAEDMRQ